MEPTVIISGKTRPVKTGNPTDKEMLHISSQLGASWQSVGLRLDLPRAVIDMIDHDGHTLQDKCDGTLIKWKQRNVTGATYKWLAQALVAVGLDEVAEMHCVDRNRAGGVQSVDAGPSPVQCTDAAKPIFLSYQWGIQEKVKMLKEEIEKSGLPCWWDLSENKPGDPMHANIAEGIRECEVFVGCITKKYQQSEMCNKEVKLASKQGKKIIPLLFEDDIQWRPEGALSLLLEDIIYIRMVNENGEIVDSELSKLLAALKEHVETARNKKHGHSRCPIESNCP